MISTLKLEFAKSICEFFGTAFFLFLGVGGSLTFNHSDDAFSTFAKSFCFGFSLFISLLIWAPISIGVFNPAITVALMISKNLPLLRGVFYIIFQFLGALVGSLIIKLIHPNHSGATTILNDEISISQGFFFEMFTTVVLTMAVFILIVEEKRSILSPFGAFGVGMTLFVSVLCSGPFTGASLNPARTFGTSIIWNDYGRAHWIYYFGPLLGSLLASFWWYLLRIIKNLEAINYNEDDNNNDKVDLD